MPTKLQPLGGRHRKFRRPRVGKNTTNDAGTVRVSVILLDPKKGQHKVGNITRHFHVANARVLEIARIIEERLFNGGANAVVPHVTL